MKTISQLILCLIFVLGTFLPTVKGQFYFSDSAQLSLLTASPGQELYAQFGHSAIRINDSAYSGQDLVFNYGIFDFDTPNFYLKFIRGKLPYMLGVQTMPSFLRSYQEEGREVREMPLLLTRSERQAVITFLIRNYQPENRFYAYDFFFDNCASRIRDVLETNTALSYPANDTTHQVYTYREMLTLYVGEHSWINFGFYLILGLPSDQLVNFREEMFLPDYLEDNLSKGQVDTRPLAAAEKILIPATLSVSSIPSLLRPTVVMWILAILWGLGSIFLPRHLARGLDTLLATLLFAAGTLFTFMWFGTDHIATHRNLNLLWANPLYLGVLISGWRGVNGTGWLFITGSGVVLTLVGYFGLPQTFHPAIIPILLLILFRWAIRLGWLSIGQANRGLTA
ncbi:MAG: DUF4105 domain-containing protein [Lewinellaceae bacterium]|nr:DUF4105 domain-containing protein [Lewinellaceae bacterium]